MQCRGKVLEPGLWLHQPVVLLEEETKGKRLFFFKFMRGKGGSLICWSLRPGLFMDLEDKEGNIFWLLPISWIISIIFFLYVELARHLEDVAWGSYNRKLMHWCNICRLI